MLYVYIRRVFESVRRQGIDRCRQVSVEHRAIPGRVHRVLHTGVHIVTTISSYQYGTGKAGEKSGLHGPLTGGFSENAGKQTGRIVACTRQASERSQLAGVVFLTPVPVGSYHDLLEDHCRNTYVPVTKLQNREHVYILSAVGQRKSGHCNCILLALYICGNMQLPYERGETMRMLFYYLLCRRGVLVVRRKT